MEQQHNHLNCPTFQELQDLKDKFHKLDKQAAVNTATLTTQYETIINLLKDKNELTEKLADKVSTLEQNQAVTGYQANKTTSFLEQLTWSTVSKIAAIGIILGGILLQLKK